MLIVIIASILIGVLLAPIGCIMLWNRYTYLSDSLIHASIFSAALSYVFHFPIEVSVWISCCIYFAVLSLLKTDKYGNTEIMYIASALLSSIAIISNPPNFEKILMGDILLANQKDIKIILVLLVAGAIIFKIYYKNIIKISINKEIAVSHNMNFHLTEKFLMGICILAISVSLPICGGLLLTSILIAPAMIARMHSKNPMQMIFISIVISVSLNVAGIGLSYLTNSRTTATICCLSCLSVFAARLFRSA